jgi:hypothetical protein
MAHRKTVRHFHEVGHLHELTFSCYRRLDVPSKQQHPNLSVIHGLPEGAIV